MEQQKNLDDHKFDKLQEQRNAAQNECVNLYAKNNELAAMARGLNAQVETLTTENEALKAEVEILKTQATSLNAAAMAGGAVQVIEGDFTAWHPIESAPKDQYILIKGGAATGDGYEDGFAPPMAVAKWINDKWHFAHYDSGVYGEWKSPTEWRYLPLVALG